MAMEVNGNYNYTRTDYAERLKEKQPLGKSEEEVKKDIANTTIQDEYISSEKSTEKPSGLYRLGQDENGNPKIFFDDPKKINSAEKTEQKNSVAPKANKENSNNSVEKCTGDTNKVDREIEKLKEKKNQLEQQIQSADGDPKKVQGLERRLAQVENELSQKDNETYRRQNTVFS